MQIQMRRLLVHIWKKLQKGTRCFYLPILEKFLRVLFWFANGLVFGDSSYFWLNRTRMCISLFEFPCQEGRCAWQNTDNLFLYFLHVVIFQRDSFPQTDSSSLVSNFAGHLECLWEIVAVFVTAAFRSTLPTPQLRVSELTLSFFI